MKRLLKKVLRSAWRATAPARRPIARKVHAYLVRANVAALAEAEAVNVHDRILPPLYWGFEASIEATHRAAASLSADTSLVLNSVVRELARLQMQVEILQQVVEEGGRGHAGLSIVNGSDEGHDRSDELMRVG